MTGITANTTDDEKKILIDACLNLEGSLKTAGIRVKSDLRDHYSPGWKYNHWELKGVPIRIELGPKDLLNQSFVAVRRDDGSKSIISFNDSVTAVPTLLQTIQRSLFNKAKQLMDDSIILCTSWTDFTPALDEKKMLLSPFCGSVECEENVKRDSARNDLPTPLMGAKSLCIPLQQPRDISPTEKCIHPTCNERPQFFTLFGRSY
jgi:bifunctional glutamyl/prolyl-tRNA synthetase